MFDSATMYDLDNPGNTPQLYVVDGGVRFVEKDIIQLDMALHTCPKTSLEPTLHTCELNQHFFTPI